MKKDEKGVSRKLEKRMLMVTGGLVLSALAFTGIRARNIGKEENQSKYEMQLPKDNVQGNNFLNSQKGVQDRIALREKMQEEPLAEGELDYMPGEDSSEVISDKNVVSRWKSQESKIQEEIADKIDKVQKQVEEKKAMLPKEDSLQIDPVQEESLTQAELNLAEEVNLPIEEFPLTMGEEEKILRPVSGEVVIPFDMEHTVYFPTLDQYKCNPAQLISATLGEEVLACANARVMQVSHSEELGNVVVLDLGNGYSATYGQVKDVAVSEGQSIEKGQRIANVGEPSRFYKLEGEHIYFALTRDNVPVNPENFY